RVKLGGTVLWGHAFANSANTDSGPTPWALTAELMCNGTSQWLNGMVLQETGNPGGVSSITGIQTPNPSGGAGPTPIYFSNSFFGLDLTAAQYFDATVQWAGGHGASTILYPIIAVTELL